MRKFCTNVQLLVISLIILISTSNLFSQTKGTWSVGYSIGIFTKGGLSLDYFVHDNLSVEVFLGGIPHIFNRGFGINVFPSHNKKYFIHVGIANFGSWNPVIYHELETADSDTLIFKMMSATGLNIGLGYNSLGPKKAGNSFLLSMGANYVIVAKREFVNRKQEKVIKDAHDMNILGFFEFGYRRRFD